MTKEFGEWLGGWGPIPFDDPGEWVAPKKKKLKEIVEKSQGGKITSLGQLGFVYRGMQDLYERTCYICGRRVMKIPSWAKSEAIDMHNEGTVDLRTCKTCDPKKGIPHVP